MATTHDTPVDDPTRAGRFALPRGVRIQEYALVAVIIALLVVGAILKPDTFPTSDNLRAIFTQSSVVGVIAIGMTLVIATSGHHPSEPSANHVGFDRICSNTAGRRS
jgi:ABC-type xylose transport system permease subunit